MSEPDLPTSHPELGYLRGVYLPRWRSLLMIALSAAGLGALLALLMLVIGDRRGGGPPLLISLFGLVPLLLGARYGLGLRVGLYSGGLLYTRLGRGRAVPWGEVAWLRNLSGQNKLLPMYMEVGLRGGGRLTLAAVADEGPPPAHERAMGLAAVIREVERACLGELLWAARRAYDEGAEVSFGRLAVSRAGLRVGRSRLPWGEVDDIELAHRHLLPLRRGRLWRGLSLVGLRNGQILPELITHARGWGYSFTRGESAGRGARALSRRANALGCLIISSPFLLIVGLFAFDYLSWSLDPRQQIDTGRSCMRQGDLACALGAFDRAVALAPGDPEPLTRRGRAHEAQGRLALALADHERALELRPGYPLALVNLGRVLAAEGRHAQAVAAYDRALAPDPAYAWAVCNRALSRRALGDPGAEADVAACGRLAPASPCESEGEAQILRQLAGPPLGQRADAPPTGACYAAGEPRRSGAG